jgi:phage shock protein C
MNNQKLYRSNSNKVFAGVCGGIAEYFDVDPVVIRILFVLMVLFGGTGVVLYIAAIFIVPKRPFFFSDAPPVSSDMKQGPKNESVRNWFGIALVVIGILLLLANMEVFHFFDFVENTFDLIFPVLLIILGMAIIYYRQSRPDQPPVTAQEGEPAAEQPFQTPGFRQFRRSMTDKKIFGVCGGLAQYFAIDSSLVRMLYVVLCLASFGAGFVLYLLLALIVPYENVFTSRVS